MMYTREELDKALAVTGLMEHDEFKNFVYSIRKHNAWTMYNNKTIDSIYDELYNPEVYNIAMEGLFLLFAELAQVHADDIKKIYTSFVSSGSVGDAGLLSQRHNKANDNTDVVYELIVLLNVYR